MTELLLDITRVLNETFIDASLGTLFYNIMDLMLLMAVIYGFFKMLKGTEASQVIIGMILILSLYWISILLGFHSTEWLFSKVANYIVLVLVIIFKDDIRKSLAKLGQSKLGKNNFWESNSKGNLELSNIEEIVKALEILSKKYIGALILIEQNANLEDILVNKNSGIVNVYSNIKKEIIEAIFHHESPIHDGAMIIKNGKIAFTGVFLPISNQRNLPGHYGTRHRAGIGISEKTDAIVLIVSEERGTISIVHHGMVRSVEDIKELRESLHSLLLKEEKENNKNDKNDKNNDISLIKTEKITKKDIEK